MYTLEEALKRSEKVSKLIGSELIKCKCWWLRYCSNCNSVIDKFHMSGMGDCSRIIPILKYIGPNWYTTDLEKINEINGLAIQYLLPFILDKDIYWNGVFLHIEVSRKVHAYSTPENVFKEQTIISNKSIASVLADLVLDVTGEWNNK